MVFCAGCAASKPAADPTPDTSATPGATASSDATSGDAAPPPEMSNAPGGASKAPASAPTPIEEAPAKGVEPLGKEEESELASKCKTFTDAVNKQARAEVKGGMKSTEAALKVLPSVPAPAGEQGARCATLLRRGLVDAIASSREAEAVTALKKIVFGMSESFAATKKLCPSTDAVPASTDALKDHAYEASRTDYATPAWKCARFDTLGAPQRFQYAVEVDEVQKSYRAIARGYAVDGGAVEQLFVELRVKDGALEPSGSVMRK